MELLSLRQLLAAVGDELASGELRLVVRSGEAKNISKAERIVNSQIETGLLLVEID